MTKLRNTHHERFVQEYVTNGLYRREAYMAVYPKCSPLSAPSSAYQLLRKPEIRRRVAEIQALTAERAGVSLYGLIREADDIQRRALAAQHHAAAVAALTVKAKLAGYWVDRIQSEAVNVSYVVTDEPLSDEEWVRKYVTPE
jgi:phage terminase small subunit